MLINIIYPCFTLFKSRCNNLVTWKESFEKINTELDLTKRKKQALDDLHSTGRISQSAYDCLSKGLTEEIEHAEARRKVLAEKMTSKLNELEEQRMALEMFLANNEMAYVAGEINEELYSKESSALDSGLEATKQELNWIKEVITQLVPQEVEPEPAPAPTPEEATEVAVSEAPVETTPESVSDIPAEIPVEVETTNEIQTEQVEASTETPPSIETTIDEGGEAPFREQAEETLTQEEETKEEADQ